MSLYCMERAHNACKMAGEFNICEQSGKSLFAIEELFNF